ncbi:methyltransferase type 11 [Candidatus Vecturithrix granuli]|uniref:Methyltransferase type 11 n=1 Tax=Vecturithrix granuli TaxID=1499967 RepID=A0A081C045_VECG1|nr:methyltransferase type 11 [Candidatus Vecturithrix granuli]
MRTVQLEKFFDAVLLADSIAYMLTEEDLRAAFRSAWTHLKPGGVLLTFAEFTQERFQQHHTECTTHAQGDVEITYIENYYDPDPGDTTYEATFVYLIRRQRKLEIQTDAHIVGIFPLELWPRCLQDVGFQVQQLAFEGYDIPTFVCLKAIHAA